MPRSILAVLAGNITWTILWLTSNAILAAMFPQAFRTDGATNHGGLLAALLILSVGFSIMAGYVTTAMARANKLKHSLALGLLQLAIGIFIQIQYWTVLPLWYHLSFLSLLIPATWLGGKLRGSGKKVSNE